MASDSSPFPTRTTACAMKDDEKTSASTLVLVRDAEYELYVSPGSIVFPLWGAVEAKGTRRIVKFSISLLPHSLDQDAQVPLVITAPFTPRFQLRAVNSTLLPLLRVGCPLELEVEFVVPRDEDNCDCQWPNFQDQVIIQTRLARLSVRLSALKDGTADDDMSYESFHHRQLPTVKAPSFKLFDQIERDATAASPTLTNTCHRVNISTSFHPQKNAEQQTHGLAPLPPRQPTPPQQFTSISRPTSASSHRTPSPRVLGPLMPVVPVTASAVVDNQTDAREVILRLRARRSSMNSTTAKPSEKNDHSPTCPEIQLDPKAKAELEEFNTLVKVAKMNVVGEMTKARQALDFYKSLLPGQPSTSGMDPYLRPQPESEAGRLSLQGQNRISKKPSRLPALSKESEGYPIDATPQQGEEKEKQAHAGTNQESSPVKRSSISNTKVTKSAHEPQQQRIQTPPTNQRVRTDPKSVLVSKTPNLLPAKPTPAKRSLVKSKKVPATTASKSSKRPIKAIKKTPLVVQHDAALDDFDDSDPEIDDAPVIPDDFQRLQCDEEDQDDPMLTSKAPLY